MAALFGCQSEGDFAHVGTIDIPGNINTTAMIQSNETTIAMQKCCAPNEVKTTGDCVLWCQVPEGRSQEDALDCLEQYSGAAVMYNFPAPPPSAAYSSRPTLMGVAAVMLLVSGFLTS